MAALGLRCCTLTSSSGGAWGLLLAVVHRLLLAWWLLLQSTGSRCARLQQLQRLGLAALWRLESSQTRYGNRVPCSGRPLLTHWTTRGVLGVFRRFSRCEFVNGMLEEEQEWNWLLQFCLSLVRCPWANCLTSPNLSFQPRTSERKGFISEWLSDG